MPDILLNSRNQSEEASREIAGYLAPMVTDGTRILWGYDRSPRLVLAVTPDLQGMTSGSGGTPCEWRGLLALILDDRLKRVIRTEGRGKDSLAGRWS
jgi:hypothetical protein